MRELKFRAYNPETKVMVNNLTMSAIAKEAEFKLLFTLDCYILEQFTGLLDINGNEIYEGDLIKNTAGLSLPVVFKDGCFMWNNEPLCYDMSDIDNPVYLPENWAVVSGTIHDTPIIKIGE